ncbi:hypothetical protein P4S73_18145 [Paraglaciecola sp. Hal342]
MIRINASDYQAKLAQANAELKGCPSCIGQLPQQQITLQDKKIDEAKANIDAAKAEVKRGELNLARFQILDKQAFDSKQQLQNTEADVAVAKSVIGSSKSCFCRRATDVFSIGCTATKCECQYHRGTIANSICAKPVS